MTTINSLSGGKTSSFMALNFETDINIFSCVKLDIDDLFLVKQKDYRTKYTDKVWQYFRWQIDENFYQTAEDDKTLEIIYHLEKELEQKTRKVQNSNEWNIKIVSSKKSFDNLINKRFLPNFRARTCTENLKVLPIYDWQKHNLGNEVVKMNLGFRADEIERTVNLYFKLTPLNKRKENKKFDVQKFINTYQIPNYIVNWWDRLEVFEKVKKGILIPKKIPFNIIKGDYCRVPDFPLIENKITNSEIIKFWKSKPNYVFPEISNCVGCFFHSINQLKKQFEHNISKMNWFEKQEIYVGKTFGKKKSLTEIKKLPKQLEMDYYQTNSCDSGFCTD